MSFAFTMKWNSIAGLLPYSSREPIMYTRKRLKSPTHSTKSWETEYSGKCQEDKKPDIRNLSEVDDANKSTSSKGTNEPTSRLQKSAKKQEDKKPDIRKLPKLDFHAKSKENKKPNIRKLPEVDISANTEEDIKPDISKIPKLNVSTNSEEDKKPRKRNLPKLNIRNTMEDNKPDMTKIPKLDVPVKKEEDKKPDIRKPPDPDLSNALTLSRAIDEPWKLIQRSGWGTLRLGTSGYVYSHWKNIVYPKGAPSKEWFKLYTRLFDTVEMNNTFYRLPSTNVMDTWNAQAPPGFCYALKFSRYGTHLKKLKDPEGPISLFLDRAIRLKDDCLGPILVQLPPKFDLNIERLIAFLERLPQNYRWAIEFRDTSWLCDEVYGILQAHNASLCIHDHEDIPFEHPKILTTNWTYIRFHGDNYRRRYTLDELQSSAMWIRDLLERGIDVYAYFNNDHHGYAPYNALELRDFIFNEPNCAGSQTK